MKRVWRMLAVLFVASLQVPSAKAADQKPIVAVFDVELGPRVKLPKAACDGIADYLATRLTESGRYQVVPRDQLRQRLFQEKKKSHKECFDQSCQIDIGKELAAEKTLSSKVMKLGLKCTVTLTLFDLRKATTESAASQRGKCDEEGVVGSLEKALEKLFGEANQKQKTVSGVAGLEWVRSKPAGIDFAKTETTVAQYRACVEAGTCSRPQTKSESKDCNWGYADRDEHPINCVDWNQAKAFCEWAGGRLPTVQEWQAEASNEGGRIYPWGDEEVSCDRAVWGGGKKADGCGRGSTWPVCSKPAGNSVSGLCDMAGNVWEWTSSLHDSEHDWRVVRGGAWTYDPPEYLRATNSGRRDPRYWSRYDGMRCVRP